METTAQRLSGKVAIVTGATANLGLAVAGCLASQGADVVLNYHRAEREAETRQAATAVSGHGGKVLTVQADVTSPSEVERLFASTIDAFGAVDILVNNAGLVIKKPLAETTDDDFDRVFAVNTRAAFLTMRQAARHIRDGGRVVNVITSIVAFTIPFYGVYAASKGAVEHLTKALAKELGDREVTVNCVAPGPLNTSFYFPVETPASIAGAKSRAAGNRLGEIEDVAPLIAFLCGPEARWITGQTLRANGGMA